MKEGKPFFYRIDLIDLFDFATEPEGMKMSLLDFVKELKKGRSDIPAIQKIIEEAFNYIEKKKKAGSSGGLARASSAQAVLKQNQANPSIPQASNRSSSSTEAVPETIKPKTKSVASLPDWIPVKAWEGYSDMRKTQKKAMTPYAAELRIKDLDRLRKEGHNPEDVLNQSTKNSWTDLYPVKENPNGKSALEALFSGTNDSIAGHVSV